MLPGFLLELYETSQVGSNRRQGLLGKPACCAVALLVRKWDHQGGRERENQDAGVEAGGGNVAVQTVTALEKQEKTSTLCMPRTR